MEEYNKISLSSSNEINEGAAYYSDLKTLNFTPETKICEIKPKAKKGRWFWWKLFGLLPLVPLKAWGDLYMYSLATVETYTKNIEEYFNYTYDKSVYILKGTTVYEKAKVKGITHKDGYIERHFDNNDAAMKYFVFTKKKCEYYNNKLK